MINKGQNEEIVKIFFPWISSIREIYQGFSVDFINFTILIKNSHFIYLLSFILIFS